MDEKIDKVYFALLHLDKENVLELLDEEIDPNYYAIDGTAPGITCYLYKAVARNEVDIVEKLLKKGADPNFEDDEGETPLFAALENDMDYSIQTLLYEYGANKNHKNKAGNTPLMHLALRDSDHGFRCTDKTLFNLLSGCVDFSERNSREQSLIHLIPYVHTCEQVIEDEEHVCRKYLRILLSNGISVNTTDGSSLTPLHYACKTCCMDAVILLFENGADLEQRTNSGQSVVHLLGCNSDRPDFQKILEFLLGKGCSITDTDSRGRTILHYITESNKANREAIESVIAHGLEPNQKDNFGLSPLHLSTIPSLFTSRDHIEDDEEIKFDVSDIVKILVEKGADVNATDRNGLTPLHYILRYEKKATTVREFLLCGADATLRTKTGETAIHRGTIYPNLLQVLLEHINSQDLKLVVNLKDKYGSSALHWAIYYFEEDCVNMLIRNGADIKSKDDESRTPAQFATYLKRTEIFKSLGILHSKETHPLPYILQENMKTNDQPFDKASDDFGKEYIIYRRALPNNQLGDTLHKEEDEALHSDSIKAVTDYNFVTAKSISHETSSKLNAHLIVSGESDNESESNDHSVKSEESDTELGKNSDFQANEMESCIGVDHMWCNCPILKTLWCEGNHIEMDDWKEHIEKHKRSLDAYMKLICNSNEMGLYQETKENTLIEQHVHRVMDFLANEVEARYPALKFNLKLAGSWSEGTKVVYPEEFDYKLILENFGKVFEPLETDEPGLQGFVKFVLKKDVCAAEFLGYVNANGFLDGRKVVRALYVAINTILIDLPADILEHLYPVKYLDTEKGSIDHVSFRWVGWSYKNMLIDIDIVPSIVPSSWVPKCFIHTRKLLQKGTEMPFPVVIKTPSSRYTKNWNTYFRISMADREVAIFKSLPSEILKGYILVKSLLRTLYFPQIYVGEDDYYREQCLTSYLIKTAFFHVLENQTVKVSDSQRNDSKTVIAIKMAQSIVIRLGEAITEKRLEPYFLSGVNTLVNESLYRFNDEHFYECEVKCLSVLLSLGYTNILREEERRHALDLLKKFW